MLPPPKFAVFSAISSSDQSRLSDVFGVRGVFILMSSGSCKLIRLSDEILSLSLEYIYRKAGAEVMQFNDMKYVSKIGEVCDGIVYCKSRIEEGQDIRVVGGLDDVVDLQSFTGVNFKVPVIDRFSPLAVSLASHFHYTVVKHRGAETVYRMSLQFVKIIGGRSLMKRIREECIFCRKLLLKYVKQIMGPLSDQQLSVSPIFFFTFADIWGPLRAYIPKHQRNTRAGDKSYEVYVLVFGCAATSMVNCQVLEGGKSAADVVDAMNRFFAEMCVPKVFYIDQDSALVKVLREGELDLMSSNGILSRERGIVFQTCPPQGHNCHGRIERRIKMLQEAFERSELKMYKLSGLGWQTVCKRIEHDVNSIPLGYLNHREDCAPMLRILTPNFLKMNAGANRSPTSLFKLPESTSDLTQRIEDAYRTFYRIWDNDYVPLVASRQKWHESYENLQDEDIVYFKLKDSPFSSRWLIGKIEGRTLSKDGKVRKVSVGYKFDTEQGSREFRVVERPARECVKLWNLEDTTIFDDIRAVHETCRSILCDDELLVVPEASIANSWSLGSYAVNSGRDSSLVHSISSVNIGTHARLDECFSNLSLADVSVQSGYGDDMINDDLDKRFFEIEYDNYDKIYDDTVLLL